MKEGSLVVIVKVVKLSENRNSFH